MMFLVGGAYLVAYNYHFKVAAYRNHDLICVYLYIFKLLAFFQN